ncbi:MAG: carbonic anhydrase [Legionellaceae bacterium]|nr:carbonic anhydrase [Legionellaceae bacterium]
MLGTIILFIWVAIISFMPLRVLSADPHPDNAALAKDYIEKIEEQDKAYIAVKGSDFFQGLTRGQTPRATVVACSDSRVQNNILDKTPEGNLFMVSNIGNQISTSLGSVEYGINHLGSSLLLIIGHSRCGAIEVARGNYTAQMEAGIINELKTIHITNETTNIDAVKANVNNQVNAALIEFNSKIINKQLMVVGAVYDFANDMKQGAGMLNIININGSTELAKLNKMMVLYRVVSLQKHSLYA